MLNNEQQNCLSKNAIARITSLDSITQTGIYNGSFISGYSWQIGLALMQNDGAGVEFIVDSVLGNAFIANKANKGAAWKTEKVI